MIQWTSEHTNSCTRMLDDSLAQLCLSADYGLEMIAGRVKWLEFICMIIQQFIEPIDRPNSHTDNEFTLCQQRDY